MNLSYLKYAVEVEKTGSITKAAQNFYMNQPHLSKIIRELERELGEDIFDLIKEVQAKTVSSDFDEQLDASERLYGCNLKFFFTKRDADKLVKQATGYSDEVKERVQTLLQRQIDKYAYLIHTS